MARWVEGLLRERIDWTDRLHSLRFEADLPEFTAGQFIQLALDLDGQRIARPYSLVNPPGTTQLEVYLGQVPNGPLSPHLAKLEPGDRLWVSAQAHGFFTLGDIPASRDLWMLATGTGIGPFLSMLATEQPWQRYQNIRLVQGARYAQDLAYPDLIRGMQDRHPHRFRYLPTTSGNPDPARPSGRIPALLADGRLEQLAELDINPTDSHVMMCGHAGMIEEVSNLLIARGMKRHRRIDPGQFSSEKYH